VALLDASSAIVEALARERPAFTSDDVWAALAQDTAGDSDARAIANAFIRAERTGLVRNSRVGAYLRGTQAHRRWLTVWLSTALAASPEDAAVYARDCVAAENAAGLGTGITAACRAGGRQPS
jgi:hypothetical protein